MRNFSPQSTSVMKPGPKSVFSFGPSSIEVKRSFTFCTTVVISGCSFKSARRKLLRAGKTGVPVTSTTMISLVAKPRLTSTCRRKPRPVTSL